MQQQEVGAAVDQSIAVVVGGQHPVWSRWGVWRRESSPSFTASDRNREMFKRNVEILTLEEGNCQFSRLGGVLGDSSAADGVDRPISTK